MQLPTQGAKEEILAKFVNAEKGVETIAFREEAFFGNNSRQREMNRKRPSKHQGHRLLSESPKARSK